MKCLFSIGLILFGSVGFAQDVKFTIADFGGMAGCWERSDKTRALQFTEQWMKPAGTSILGMGRTVRNEKTIDFEFMRIEQRPDGIYFVARPKSNTDETSFKLISAANKTFVFENPDHDFPQRVSYRLNKATQLIGRIEGTESGKLKGIDFPYQRVKCE
jgi:hypothetical protein